MDTYWMLSLMCFGERASRQRWDVDGKKLDEMRRGGCTTRLGWKV